MSRQYPIWNIINSCAYANGNKSYGVKKHSACEIRVGTNSKNSHHFLKHEVTHREYPNGDRTYHFYIDGNLFKSAKLPKGKDELVDVQIYYDLGL